MRRSLSRQKPRHFVTSLQAFDVDGVKTASCTFSVRNVLTPGVPWASTDVPVFQASKIFLPQVSLPGIRNSTIEVYHNNVKSSYLVCERVQLMTV
jgi:hypothetical protein